MRAPLEILLNFHWIVAGEAARSAQPPAALLSSLLASGKIRSLINLRGENPAYAWWRRERGTCASLGVAHVDAMLDSRKLPTRAMLVSLFYAFDTAGQPALMKCSGGQDRTSLAAALYILHRKGWSAQAKAMAQFSRLPYLHFPKRRQRWLREFPLYAAAASDGAPVAQWARDSYDPQAFARWLGEKGLAASHAEIFEKPSVPFSLWNIAMGALGLKRNQSSDQ